MVKYADDTSLTGFITHDDAETGYRNEIDRCVDWYRVNVLILNAQQNTDLFYFRSNQKLGDSAS